MSKIKLGDSGKIDSNIKSAWVDRNRLNGETDLSFADILKTAMANNKKVKLSDVKSTELTNPLPMVDGVYHVSLNKKNKDFSETDRYKKIHEDFKMSKLKKTQDKEIVKNFVDNILIPKLQEAYNKGDAAHKIIYNEKKELMGALDRNAIKPGDIITGVVERWIDSSKQYRVLVGKKDDSVAWAFINDPEEEKFASTGDIVYFVSDLNSAGKLIFKEYLPKEGDLKVGDVLSIRNLYDDGKTDYLSMKIGQYTGVFYKKFLPKGYTSEQPLMLKIKNIIKKDGHSIFKFDEDFVFFDQKKDIKSTKSKQKETNIDVNVDQKQKVA